MTLSKDEEYGLSLRYFFLLVPLYPPGFRELGFSFNAVPAAKRRFVFLLSAEDRGQTAKQGENPHKVNKHTSPFFVSIKLEHLRNGKRITSA